MRCTLARRDYPPTAAHLGNHVSGIAEFGRRETLADDPETRFANLLKVGLEDTLA